jgi:undecaprenyl diphosphate synthase
MTVHAPLSAEAFDPVNHATPPRHVGVIMDGNGRWAAARGLPRVVGHKHGVEALRRCVEAAVQSRTPYLTLYGFSTENWRRPRAEVDDLFSLARRYLKSDLTRLKEQGVRVRMAGERDGLARDIVELVEHAEHETADGAHLTLTIAFNYGGRYEIAKAAAQIARASAEGRLNPETLSEDVFEEFLETGDLPDMDLLIRTSGERRISNFLLWRAAYAELAFLDVLWPDFQKQHFFDALRDYACRERRFGGAGSAVKASA